jgi:hypothetical protein
MIVHESHNSLIVRSASLINDCFSHADISTTRMYDKRQQHHEDSPTFRVWGSDVKVKSGIVRHNRALSSKNGL